VLFRSLDQTKNREKSRERYYLPVCSRLTSEPYGGGTGPKGLTVMRMKVLWNAGHLFFILKSERQLIHPVLLSYSIQYPQEGLRLQVSYRQRENIVDPLFMHFLDEGISMSLKNNLAELKLEESAKVTFTYEEGTDVFHFNETHVDDALNGTDVVDRLASAITSGLQVASQYGGSPLESLRDADLLDAYERGNFAFEGYVAETIRDNFYDADLIEESTERFDHKRGFTTLSTTLSARVADVLSQVEDYAVEFSGWKAEVSTNNGMLTFTV